MLKMSSAFDVAFFLSMLPYVVNLSGFFLFGTEGKFVSIDFRFVTQYLIHSYGIMNVFRYHYSTRVTAVA